MAEDVMLNLILSNIPYKFIEAFHGQLAALYRESHSSVSNYTLWLEPEAKFVLPYHRRGICEAAFRRTALDSGLRVRDLQHNARNCNYVLVRAGKILLTQVAVREGEGIRPAKSREQHAAVNQFLNNPGFEFIDAPDFRVPGAVYGTIVHGPDKQDSARASFAYLLFPPAADASENTPVFKYPLAFLMQEYKNLGLHRQTQKMPTERKQPKIKGDKGQK